MPALTRAPRHAHAPCTGCMDRLHAQICMCLRVHERACDRGEAIQGRAARNTGCAQLSLGLWVACRLTAQQHTCDATRRSLTQ
eukprot:364271-Chlamydomonas_euryale.AAC.6